MYSCSGVRRGKDAGFGVFIILLSRINRNDVISRCVGRGDRRSNLEGSNCLCTRGRELKQVVVEGFKFCGCFLMTFVGRWIFSHDFGSKVKFN